MNWYFAWQRLTCATRYQPTGLLQVIRGSNGTNVTAAILCANAVVYKDQLSRLERLPDELWIQVYPNSSMVTANNNFRVESFTTQSARQSGNFIVNSTDQHTATTFSFMGTGAQFISCVGPQFGVARIYLDGKLVEDIDASITPWWNYARPNHRLLRAAALFNHSSSIWSTQFDCGEFTTSRIEVPGRRHCHNNWQLLLSQWHRAMCAELWSWILICNCRILLLECSI